MANVTPAIKRIMTKGEWRFDGKGYLASRIASESWLRLQSGAKRLRNAYILYGTAQVLTKTANEKGLPLPFPILI